jgi:hypothetical protein
MRRRVLGFGVGAVFVLCSCGQSSGSDDSGQATATGGAATTGGAANATGGTVEATGGRRATGGTASETGGIANSTGGRRATGGASSSGGTAPNETGGSTTVGGATGGSAESGGEVGAGTYFMEATIDGETVYLDEVTTTEISNSRLFLTAGQGTMSLGWVFSDTSLETKTYECGKSSIVMMAFSTDDLQAYDYLRDDGACTLELTASDDAYSGTFSATLVAGTSADAEAVVITDGSFRLPLVE